MLPPFQMVSDDLRIFKGRFEEIPFTASCRADEAMQSGGDGVHPWSAWVAMACTTPGYTALDDGDDADDVHSWAAWETSAGQKIQKLSESPATAHMVAKLCFINWKNRNITHRLVLLNFLNRTSGSHQWPARQHSAGHYIKTCQSFGEVLSAF